VKPIGIAKKHPKMNHTKFLDDVYKAVQDHEKRPVSRYNIRCGNLDPSHSKLYDTIVQSYENRGGTVE